MASVNKCTFIGNLTKDVDLRFMPNGEAVGNCSIACNEQWKDKSGEKQEGVEFINLVFYRGLAEIVAKYCRKGSQIYVEGKFKTRKWEKDGVTRYSTEIVVSEMTMLGSKPDGTRSDPAEHHAGARQVEHPGAGGAKPARQANQGGASNFDDIDDIPF